MAKICAKCGVHADEVGLKGITFCTKSLITGDHQFHVVPDVPKADDTTPSVRGAARPTFERIFIDFAEALSKRSTCARLQVGCVIASRDFRQVFSIGYNGNVAGGKNDCDRHGVEAVGNCGCIHAEQNAVINCTAPRQMDKIVFCTHLPCLTCAKFLINLGGVRHILYKNDYRIKDSLTLFDANGISHEHIQ